MRCDAHKFGETDVLYQAGLTSFSCAIANDSVDDFSLPIALAERAVGKNPKGHLPQHTLGFILYRAGQFERSLAELNKAKSLLKRYLQKNQQTSGAKLWSAFNWFVLAMTHHRLGNTEQARQCCDKAIARANNLQASDRNRQWTPTLLWDGL